MNFIFFSSRTSKFIIMEKKSVKEKKRSEGRGEWLVGVKSALKLVIFYGLYSSYQLVNVLFFYCGKNFMVGN